MVETFENLHSNMLFCIRLPGIAFFAVVKVLRLVRILGPLHSRVVGVALTATKCPCQCPGGYQHAVAKPDSCLGSGNGSYSSKRRSDAEITPRSISRTLLACWFVGLLVPRTALYVIEVSIYSSMPPGELSRDSNTTETLTAEADNSAIIK